MNDLNSYSVVTRNDLNKPALFEGTKQEVYDWLTNGKPWKRSAWAVYDAQTKTYSSAMLFVNSVEQTEEMETKRTEATVVPKFYTMDPDTEDLLRDGKYLANGMRVLVESPNDRGRPEEAEEKDWMKDRVLERNRWCTVSNLESRGNLIRFVAIYDDGTKRLRMSSFSSAWLVKIDSIPDPVLAEEKEAEKYNKVFDLVRDVISETITVTTSESSDMSKELELLRLETTKKIFGLL